MSFSVAVQNDSSESFLLNDWNYYVNETSRVFRLTEEEANKLKSSSTAKLIAVIPFAAGCSDPERLAISHLCLYMAEKQGFQRYCAHVPSDDTDLMKRLELLANFPDGDKEVINHSMKILALIMINGYKKSAVKDSAEDIYNPIASGKWDYRTMKNQLIWEINKKYVPETDWILPEIYDGLW